MSEQGHVVKKNGEMDTGMVDDAIKRIPPERVEDILESFGQFKSYLKVRMDLGKKIGLDEEQLTKTAEKISNYLAEHVEPKNREEKLLQELWKVGNQEERHKLAHLLVKLVDNEMS
ncbi:DUF3243 domain-containing protein [Peribacillus saganii]|uniref:DUF3243 domain-containing protein n=1 Tax=Peribacillus saganii TaxID=2303992 RepID=A0A372LRH3_9BACI|nr:DUF3243 domain-containing protein [Peribacillus saganii]RFU70646.1 DUF3243 domain-containing protein [Peribacillus saganii]